jgi:hypothetical protein
MDWYQREVVDGTGGTPYGAAPCGGQQGDRVEPKHRGDRSWTPPSVEQGCDLMRPIAQAYTAWGGGRVKRHPTPRCYPFLDCTAIRTTREASRAIPGTPYVVLETRLRGPRLPTPEHSPRIAYGRDGPRARRTTAACGNRARRACWRNGAPGWPGLASARIRSPRVRVPICMRRLSASAWRWGRRSLQTVSPDLRRRCVGRPAAHPSRGLFPTGRPAIRNAARAGGETDLPLMHLTKHLGHVARPSNPR